jgi:hypothetical protein
MGQHGDALGLQVIEGEGGVALADGAAVERRQHPAAAEHLGLEPLAPGAQLEQVVDEQLHGVGAVARRGAGRALLGESASRKWFSPPTPFPGIAQAHRDAGAQHRDQQHVAPW